MADVWHVLVIYVMSVVLMPVSVQPAFMGMGPIMEYVPLALIPDVGHVLMILVHVLLAHRDLVYWMPNVPVVKSINVGYVHPMLALANYVTQHSLYHLPIHVNHVLSIAKYVHNI